MLVLLALAAGCVDASSYLGLGEVLTAAMTGNTILLGLAIGQGKMEAAFRSTVALVGFMLGAVLAAAMRRGERDEVWPRSVTVALAFELVVLAGLAVGWHLAGDAADETAEYLYPLIATAGIAMGIQSAAVHRLGVAGVSTTYITGTLTSLAVRSVAWLRALSHATAAPAADSGPNRSGRDGKAADPGYPAIVWLAYGAGAAAAGAVKLWWPTVSIAPVIAGSAVRWPTAALLLPILVVAMVALLAGVRFWNGRSR